MTTKVKFLQSISSNAGSFATGEVVTLETSLAGPWIKSGVCESVEPVKAPVAPTETKAEKTKREVAEKKAAEDAQFEKELAELEKAEADKATPAATPAADDLT